MDLHIDEKLSCDSGLVSDFLSLPFSVRREILQRLGVFQYVVYGGRTAVETYGVAFDHIREENKRSEFVIELLKAAQ